MREGCDPENGRRECGAAWVWAAVGMLVGGLVILLVAWWRRLQEAMSRLLMDMDFAEEEPTTPQAGDTSPPAEEVPSSSAAPTPTEADAPPDDLKVIEGIGPKIEQVLHDAGIRTYAQLAATGVDRLREVLAAAGSRFRLADPSTWPEQARLAADGRWEELQALQARLKGGRRRG